MNITEFMSFDLEWFTTLPGLLITGGVIVLLIALIIFIVSNKKTEKKKEEEANNIEVQNVSITDNMNPVKDMMPSNDQIGLGNVSLDNNFSAPVNNNVNPMDNNVMNTAYVAGAINNLNNIGVEPVSDAVENNVFKATSHNVVIPTINEEQSTVDNSSLNTAPVVDSGVNFQTPVVEPQVNNYSQPVSEFNNTPVVNESVIAPVEPTAPVVMETPVVPTPVVEERPTIYGGVNPVNTISNQPVVKPTIYGGANPLENTTTIPTITNHGAYGTSSASVVSSPFVNETVSVTPSVSVPTNEVEPVQPVVNPIVEPVVPTVEPTPVVADQFTPVMPMTGAEMFGTNDVINKSVPINTSNEIETLEF